MILVVGASGQLGSIITRRLLELGKSVRILVRDNPAYQELIALGGTACEGRFEGSRITKRCHPGH